MTTKLTLLALKRKLIGLIHWWLQLEPIRHRHWCEIDAKGCGTRCEHEGSAWMCEGVFCAEQERKNCPGCASGKPCPPVPYENRRYGYNCACGLGNMLLLALLLSLTGCAL